MDAEPVYRIQWSEEKLRQLEEQLTGVWAEDAWPMTVRGTNGQPVQRFFQFTFASRGLNVEFKYALWYRFEKEEKSQTRLGKHTLYYALLHLRRWLNQVAPELPSLTERSLDFWLCSLRTYLVEAGRYHPPKHSKKLHSSQTYYESGSEDKHICIFRVLYRTILEAYDERPEMEKEIWNLRKLGCSLNLSNSTHILNFTLIVQPWLRRSAQLYMKYMLPIRSVAACHNKLFSIRHFSLFLEECAPQAQAANIDRVMILNYLSALQTEHHLSAGTRNRYLMNLRHFLETCAHRLCLPGFTREQLIFEEDLSVLPEYGTREIPQEVQAQLREHLQTLPTTLLRMVTILLEVGLRVNELCQLPLNCLTYDDKHEWYLHYYQSKTHTEQVIPLVQQEVIGAIQAQQQEIRERWGESCVYLFPSASSRRLPFKQSNFGDLLNKWAVTHEIRDRTGKLYRFTAHQFRHSLGMRLINEDVPIEVVSRLLGHKTLTMTQIYARVRDKKMRADLERAARKRKTVDYQGKEVKGDPRANDPEVQMTRKGVRGQTLAVGGCARLVVLGDCSHANKCLTCPMWLTSTDDLPALKSFYQRATRLKERASAVGNQVVIEQQDRIIPLLAVRIKSLEEAPMDGSLCVEDVLAQLRTDLAEAESALEEAREAGLVLAAKHLERIVEEIKTRLTALEESA